MTENQLKVRWNLAYDIAFSLDSNDPRGDDVTPEMVRQAIIRRLSELSDSELMESIGAPFDAYEEIYE